MSTRKRHYRLPDGEFTTNSQRYCDTWNDLGKKAASFFPGYECNGYDPDVHLVRKDRYTPGVYARAIVLPVHAILALTGPKGNT